MSARRIAIPSLFAAAWLSSGAAVAQLQPCPANCAEVSVGGGAGRHGDTVRIPISLAQGAADAQAGGADEVGAVVLTLGIPGLELDDCHNITSDGLTAAVEVPAAIAAGFRVVLENTSCTDRSRCLCPSSGQERDQFVNVVVFGPQDPPPGMEPVTIPVLPNGELFALRLRISPTAPTTIPLHVFTEEDDQGEIPKPAFGAFLSVGDTQAVDQTADFSSNVSKLATADGVVHVVTTTCAGDCNSSGNVTASDVAKISALITACPCGGGASGGLASGCAGIPGSDKQCMAADMNSDGCITAGELNAILFNVVHSPSGCPSE